MLHLYPVPFYIQHHKGLGLSISGMGYAAGINHQTFLTLAFLSLPVIPELKLTDRGLVKVLDGRIIGIDEKM